MAHYDEVADLMAENGLLRKALEFYADPRRYNGSNLRPIKGDGYAPVGLVYCYDVLRDHGKIARKALG